MWTFTVVVLVGIVLYSFGVLYAFAFSAAARRGWLAVDDEPSLLHIGATWLVSGTLFAALTVWGIDVVQRWLAFSPTQSTVALTHAPLLGLCSVGMASRTLARRLWPRHAESPTAPLEVLHPSTLAAAGWAFILGAVLALLLVVVTDWPRLIFG